jgi:hypothetical protein
MSQIGERVLGRRSSEDYWYPGTIRHVQDGRFYVIFDDGEDALLTEEHLRPLRLEVGERVLARREAEQDYQPARVAEQAEDRVLLEFEDGTSAWTALGLIRWRPATRRPAATTASARQWELGDRVLACWLDLDWYPGIVLADDGKRVHVLYDTGTQAPVAPDKVRPLEIAAGDRVLGRRWNGPDYLPGEVIELKGEKIRVHFDEGEIEWTSLRLLRLQRDEWLPGGDGGRFAAGDRVLACWYDLFWYPGVILSVEGKRVHVAFDDGDQALVTPDQVEGLDIGVGDRVFCRWKGGPQFYPGEVVQKEGERIHVRYDDGDEEWTSVRMVRVEK